MHVLQVVLFAVALLLGQNASAGDARVVRVRVVTGGDLRWSGPCRATAFGTNQARDDVKSEVDDVARPLSLPPGHYEVVVSCTSSEGIVRKSAPLVVAQKDVDVEIAITPAFLLARVTRNGRDVKAALDVIDECGRVVVEGRDHAVFPVPSGKLHVVARVDADDGTTHSVRGSVDVTAHPGVKEACVVDVTDGRITITVTENGKPIDGVVAIRTVGTHERIAELRTGVKAAVPPGTFEVVSQLADGHDFAEVVNTNVVVASNKETRVVVAHTTGGLRARIVARPPLPAGAHVEVDLYAVPGDKPFNTIAAADRAKLTPGRYRVVARRLDAPLDDGTAVSGETTVQVNARSDATAIIDLTPAMLVVTTTFGGAPRALPVDMLLNGAEAPVVTRPSDDNGTVRFALPAGTWRARAQLQAAQGTLQVEHTVSVIRGQSTSTKLDLNYGTALVQAFEAGVAVPAEVRFVGDGTAPTLTSPAGQEAYLPPGKYKLVVRRKGVERPFGDVRLAAGRVVERQVELSEAVPAKPARPR